MMVNNTLTLALEGEVALQEFASAINNLNLLLIQLSTEVGNGAKIEWSIDELNTGSAIATFRGIYPESEMVENVVNAYAEVGEALAFGNELPFSSFVKKYATELTNLLNGKITALRFETSSKDFFISSKLEGEKSLPIKYSYGSVKGVVETLSKHKKLSFTLWDSLFDKPVHCYFKEGEEENMRNVWGKKVVISGKVGRQPLTGRVLIVRDVNYVRSVENNEPGSFRKARGVLQWGIGDDTAEEIIRRIRNAS